MKLVSILFFLFIAGKAYSQNYVITHDLQKERTQYLKIDKHNDTVKVKDINIKKNGRIILQVNNYNPFYWSARVTTYKKPVDNQASSGGTFNPFSFLAQGFGNFISSAMPKLDMPKANSDTYNSQGMKDAVSTVYLYKKNYEQLVQLQNQLNEMENLRLKLISLKYDIIKDEATIKAEAAQSVSKVLGTTQLEFEDVYAMGNRLDNVLQNTVDSSILLQSLIAKQQSSLNQQIAEPSVTVRGAPPPAPTPSIKRGAVTTSPSSMPCARVVRNFSSAKNNPSAAFVRMHLPCKLPSTDCKILIPWSGASQPRSSVIFRSLNQRTHSSLD